MEEKNLSPCAIRSPLSTDLFGSVCYTYQHGKFRNLYGDLTRLDARLDISSASALVRRVFNSLRGSLVPSNDQILSSPKLNFIFQQQVPYGSALFCFFSSLFLPIVVNFFLRNLLM